MVHPVVELEGIVSVREVLFGLLFDFVLLSIQSSSFVLFHIWHKQLSKSRVLYRVFLTSGEAFGSSSERTLAR